MKNRSISVYSFDNKSYIRISKLDINGNIIVHGTPHLFSDKKIDDFSYTVKDDVVFIFFTVDDIRRVSIMATIVGFSVCFDKIIDNDYFKHMGW